MNHLFIDYEMCLTNVSNSIRKYFELETKHITLKQVDDLLNKNKPKNVVLILCDGMGSNILARSLSPKSFLRSNKLMDIHSVFPPTTTAATTSVVTGLNPNEHCWLGWEQYIKDIDKTIIMYLNKIKNSEIPAANYNVANKYFPYLAIYDEINNIGKYQGNIVSPYCKKPYKNNKEMFSQIKKICNNGKSNFVYAYNLEPDTSMHCYGTDNIIVKEKIRELNKRIKNLCKDLKDTMVIVIADHGHINVKHIYLEDDKEIYNMLSQTTSIDARACALFVKKEYIDIFPKLFIEKYGNDFILYSKKGIITNKIFGTGNNNKRFNESLGDFIAIAIADKAIKYSHTNSFINVSTHAGITEDEVYVPLIIINK